MQAPVPRFHTKMTALVIKVDHFFAPEPQRQSSGNKKVISGASLIWLGDEELKISPRFLFLTAFT